MILIDNYDSFTYNLVQYLRELGVSVVVIKNDEMSISEIKKLNFNSIVISPGPSNPDNSGLSMQIINEFYKTKKILGVCLGHQCIAQFFGAKIVKAETPVHGKVSRIYFMDDEKLFIGARQGFKATRYHSLVVEKNSIPRELSVIAQTEDGIIMGLKHNNYKLFGVQFHPEAILSEYGKVLLKNFIDIEN